MQLHGKAPYSGATVTEPTFVNDPHGVVSALFGGKWVMLPRELLGDDTDLDTVKLDLLELADDMGISIQFFDIPGKDLTLVANSSALPSFDAVTDMVAALEQHRWRHGTRRAGGGFCAVPGRHRNRSA